MAANIEQLIADIDAVVPPEALDVVQEVSELIQPQLELIVALSGLEDVTANHGIDTHHFFWPRREYITGLQKQFRRVFVMPVNMGVHRELHARLEPPHMPNRSTMLGYLSLLDKKETVASRGTR